MPRLLVSTSQRRARLVARHRLAGDAIDVVDAARSVVVLHATDPATVYLSALARCHAATLALISEALYQRRLLVRMMAMRRTLFVVPQELVPIVHHAASLAVAEQLRKRLLAGLARTPTEPPLPDDVASFLDEVMSSVEAAAARLGPCSAAVLAAAEPRLRTAILPTTGKTYDVRRALTSQVLVLMGCEGRLRRDEPLGSWTSRQHTWTVTPPPSAGDALDVDEARATLVAAYLARFGPAAEADVAWWTGWGLGVTRAALGRAGAVEVDGLLLAPDDVEPVTAPAPVAALLPALDPTPMGWKQRAFFQPEDASALYDRNGNIGPTVWWDGEIVGGWAVRPDGRVVTGSLTDRGAEAASAIAAAAVRLEGRLEGTVVTPSFRTPLERALVLG